MTVLRYAEALNAALREEMERDPSVFLFGEDIGRYGGVFKITDGLMETFGESRVRDTPISEQALTAMAVTAAMTGTRPVLEIMFADFIPLSMDALINQASVFGYLWEGQVDIPFVLRTQGGGGVGTGAQHAKCMDALLAHVPGLKVVAPVTAADAKGLLKAAIRDPQPVIFLEHKLLYNTRGEVPDVGPPHLQAEGRDGGGDGRGEHQRDVPRGLQLADERRQQAHQGEDGQQREAQGGGGAVGGHGASSGGRRR